MGALVSLPAGWLLVLTLVGVAGFALSVTWLLHHRVQGGSREHAGITAAAYMTALGSLFAILTGFLLNGEYAVLRQTQNLVYQEVAAGSRLAFSTEGLPASDVAVVQDALATYFTALAASEWRALERGEPDSSTAGQALTTLQQVVFAVGSRDYAPGGSVDGVQASVSELTGIRRERIAIGTQVTPIALVALSLFTGLALIVNAVVVTLRAGRGFAVVAIGIVVIVALDLAAIVAIAAPFQGPFQASSEPVAQFAAEVRRGDYLPWIGVGR
jgi:hypothetical protein